VRDLRLTVDIGRDPGIVDRIGPLPLLAGTDLVEEACNDPCASIRHADCAPRCTPV
jgi:hypothetical protein